LTPPHTVNSLSKLSKTFLLNTQRFFHSNTWKCGIPSGQFGDSRFPSEVLEILEAFSVALSNHNVISADVILETILAQRNVHVIAVVTDPEAINFNLRYYQKESLINN
jgi:hypothetical protein